MGELLQGKLEITKSKTALIAVDKTFVKFDRLYLYSVPFSMDDEVKVGCRVIVPFGRGNSKATGLVFSVGEHHDIEVKIKPILSVVDKVPLINQEFFLIINYLVENTFCTYYDVIKTIIPLGLSISVGDSYEVNRDISNIDLDELSELEKNLLELLLKAESASEVNRIINSQKGKGSGAIARLADLSVITVSSSIKQRVADSTIKMVRLNPDRSTAHRLTKLHERVVTFLDQVEYAMEKEVLYFCGITDSVLKTLSKKGIIIQYRQKVERIQTDLPEEATISPDSITLSDPQQQVYSGVLQLTQQDKPNVALLHGITGSGKTQIYIKLIEQVLKSERQCIMLVPEIALTPSLVSKFTAMFGSKIAVSHSGLSVTERLTQWNRIKKGLAQIVIGTRSAVFAPLSNIGLIILDEEGEGSYKSDASPRYHARDIAKLRAAYHNATLLLASATPSLSSYYNAKKGRYHLFTLTERYSDSMLPEVHIIDMNNEEDNAGVSLFSRTLRHNIEQNLINNEQTILLINRRGYNTYLSCMNCQTTVTCPHCDVSLTYHKANELMMCHYCGYSLPHVTRCPSCKSGLLKYMGQGTQRIEDEIATYFPSARVLRMDTDTVFSKDSYEQNFEDFSAGRYDILVGTQMVSKGLDFPNVTLVGVLDADKGLNSPDFTSSSRVFSLITQAVGRSGRSNKAGRAFIQTFNPSNRIIQLAALQDYVGFYEYETEHRRLMLYPPFCDMVIATFSGKDELQTALAAKLYLLSLKEELTILKLPVRVLGPAPESVYKANDNFRVRITIKCKLSKRMKQLLKDTMDKTYADSRFSKISIILNVSSD